MTIELLDIDCTELPPGMGQDHLRTDPPYMPRVHDRAFSNAAGGKVSQRDFGFDSLSDELREAIAAMAAETPKWIAIDSDIEGAAHWRAELKRYLRAVPSLEAEDWTGCGVSTLPWLRWAGPSRIKAPPHCWELIILVHGTGEQHYGGPNNLVALSHKSDRSKGRHRTQKPLDRELDLIAWLTKPGELVYDPTAGRATTGVACALLGRHYIGCQHNPKQPQEFELAQQRLADAQNGVLSEYDLKRWESWLTSIGLEPMPPCELPLEFKAGVPV